MKPHDEEDDDLFDEHGMLKDGRRWRLPLRMTDSLQFGHRPGFVTDARAASEREAAYREYERTLQDAWKNPPAGEDCKVTDRQAPSSRDGTGDGRQAAYAEYEAYIAHAWRGGDQ